MKKHTITIEEWQAAAATIVDNVLLTPKTKEIIQYLCLYFSEDPRFETDPPPPFLLSENPSLKKGLLIIGPNGVGKTFAFEVFNRLHEFGLLKRYFSMTDTRTVTSDVSRNGIDAVQRYMPGDRLFNELGSEPVAKSYGNDIDAIYEIIFDREKRQCKTHFTSNLSSEEIAERYDFAILSRLRGMCNIIEFAPSDSADMRGFSNRINRHVKYSDILYQLPQWFRFMDDIKNRLYDEEALPVMFAELPTIRNNALKIYPGLFGPLLDEVNQFIEENSNPQNLMRYAKPKSDPTQNQENSEKGGFRQNGLGTALKEALSQIGK